jgi:lipopolysaccharide heptosyltransferase II
VKILLRLPNWIGDAVMALPAVLALGEARPDWEWCLRGGPRVRPVFTGLDEPFRLLPGPVRDRSTAWEFLADAWALRRERCDAAVIFTPSLRGALEARAAGAGERVGWDADGRGFLLTVHGRRPTRTRPLREQYWELAALLLDRLGGGALPRGEGSLLPRRAPLRAEEIVSAAAFTRGRDLPAERTVALAPGAAYGPTKRWPEERFAELARRLAAGGWTPLWIGGPDERALCRVLAAGSAGRSVAGELSLRQTLALLASVRAAVSNDSGAMHLAQAAGCPVVGIFGSTAPEWTGPAGADAAVVREPVSCAPCFAPRCPTQIECLRGIPVERVETALFRLLEAGPRRGRPAVFLDRDGTVIEEVNYLRTPEQVCLIPGAAAALRELQSAGYALVVITNQSAVARGLLDRAGLHAVHVRLQALLAREGVRIEGIEFCPHHPDFTGPCACRKPEPGMLLRAAHRHDLDLGRSLLVGDTAADLEAGRRAGCRSILVRTGHGREASPALAGAPENQRAVVCEDLSAAARWILSSGPSRASA